MKRAYILHGCCDRDEYESNDHPSPSNSHWIPWLQKQLLVKGYDCQTPDMPLPYAPVYDDWLAIFDKFTIDENTTLVGHSCGCGFYLKWLNKAGIKIDKLILVAPWLDPERYLGNFLQCRLKPDLMEMVNQIHVLYSDDDPVGGVRETVEMIMEGYPIAELHSFTGQGHFCLDEMTTDKFPELLSIVIA